MEMNKLKMLSTSIKAQDHYEYIIVIGISTGGPKALNTFITSLTRNLSATYIIVQHMPKGFTHSLAQRLNELSEVTVKEAENNEYLKKGTVYIAPGGKQLSIMNPMLPKCKLTDDEPYKGHKPSVNFLYNSVAKLDIDKPIIAIIMTGMGSDGLEGIESLKESTKVTVIAQNEKTSVVYGMPKAVVDKGYADYVVGVEEITSTIKKIMGV